MTDRVARAAALGQGAFWLATGLWPLVHYRSFEAVTGPKEDDWLVKSIGGLIAVVGATLLAAGLRRRVTPEIRLLGAASAAALSAADAWFTVRGRISKIYLLDIVAEAPFLAAWAFAARAAAGRGRRAEQRGFAAGPSPAPEEAYVPAT